MLKWYRKEINHKYEKEIKWFLHSDNNNLRYDFNTLESDNFKCKKRINKNDDDVEISSIIRTKRVIKDIARNNDFDYFVTFTFDNKLVDNTKIENVYKAVYNFTKKMKKKDKNFKYLLVPEYHKDGEKIHIHGLIKGALNLTKATKKDKDGNIIPYPRYKNKDVYNTNNWFYGFNTVIKIGRSADDVLKCSSYITKYVTKELIVKLNKKRYWCSANLSKGVVISSKIYNVKTIEDIYKKEEKISGINYFDYSKDNMYFVRVNRKKEEDTIKHNE